MRRSALRLGISLILIIAVSSFPKRKERSVDLNEQHKLESSCICDDLRPQSYILEIEPRIEEAKFHGHVRINITWSEKADTVTIHAHPDLKIADSDIKLTWINFTRPEDYSSEEEDDEKREQQTGPKPLKIERIERKNHKLIISLPERLKRGTLCELDIKYTGPIMTNETAGLFMNQYNDATGQKHTYLATYLRLNNARRLFPGYDELLYKAKFRLFLTRPKNMTAISNTLLKKSIPVPGDGDFVRDEFHETPEMTTYQLGFVVSDLDSIKPAKPVNKFNGKQLEVRVWGRKEYLDKLRDVPLKIVTIVNYLQDYFNSSIMMPELNVIGLPTYTASKPSDAWGLMIFKESELSSPLVWNTAYELTYQWIGQYITPYRWIDAAENKGLNSFLASMTTLDINPDELKGKWPMNILYSLYYGYGKVYGVNRGTGIIRDAKFSKIELVFRMFYYVLGKDNFKAGMRHLIQNQSTAKWELPNGDKRYPRTFTRVSIYESLGYVADRSKSLPEGLTVHKIADTWIDQGRLPLVTVQRHYENKTLTFSQKTYVRENRVAAVGTNLVYSWNIPLAMQSQQKWDNDYKPKAWLLESQGSQNLSIPDIADKNNFIVVNPEEIGLFPVNYDSRNWELLSEYLRGPKFETIPNLTRAKLLHDAWNLAYADELCFKSALNMTLFLQHERSHVVWEPFFTMIDHVGSRIEGNKVADKFRTYTRSLLEPMYTEPCDGARVAESSWKTHLRGLARYFLCRAGYEPCITEARDQFKKWMTDAEPDKGNPVGNEFICPVFKWGSKEEWEFGLQRVINFPRNSPERKQSERTYLLKTLASCTRDGKMLYKLLTEALFHGEGIFSDADVHLILSMIAVNAHGREPLFDFLNKNWQELRQLLKNKKALWTSLVQSATGSFSSQEGYDLVSKLYESKRAELNGTESFITDNLEKIKLETRWSKNNIPAIEAWLDQKLAKLQPPSSDLLDYWKTTLVCPKRTANETTSPPLPAPALGLQSDAHLTN